VAERDFTAVEGWPGIGSLPIHKGINEYINKTIALPLDDKLTDKTAVLGGKPIQLSFCPPKILH
jgi:hypothetical protein